MAHPIAKLRDARMAVSVYAIIRGNYVWVLTRSGRIKCLRYAV